MGLNQLILPLTIILLIMVSGCTAEEHDETNRNIEIESEVSEDIEDVQEVGTKNLTMEQVKEGVVEELLYLGDISSMSNSEMVDAIDQILMDKYGFNDQQISEYYDYILSESSTYDSNQYSGGFDSYDYDTRYGDFSNQYDSYDYETGYESYTDEYDSYFEDDYEGFEYGVDRDLDNDGSWDYDKGGTDRDLDNDGSWDAEFGGTDYDYDNDNSWDFNQSSEFDKDGDGALDYDQGGVDRDLDNDGYWDYNFDGTDRDLDNDGYWDHNFGGSDFDVDTDWSWDDY
ncbi:hypothetical protein [Piscibacillus halophilus]|uniref:hypothetical protein n=1 Tax=Piscibacillus halophilus TaxID=571933 RepID=UPI00158B180A|nr:hypothetical protein [Piscibacillus halophilus]